MSEDLFKDTEGVLYNYSQLKAEINNLHIEIEELKDEYVGANAIVYSEKVGQTYKISDKVSSEVINKESEILKLERLVRSKERLLAKIDIAINSLNDFDKLFIKVRYLDNVKRSWQQIGTYLNLDPNYCCNVLRPDIINKLSCLIWIANRK